MGLGRRVQAGDVMSAFACGRCDECDGGRGYEFCLSPRGTSPTCRCDCGRVLVDSEREAREEERLRIARWLRTISTTDDTLLGIQHVIARLADAVENAEHNINKEETS